MGMYIPTAGSVKITDEALIQLVHGYADKSVLTHEVFHAAMDMALTPKQKAVIVKHFRKSNSALDGEERAAAAYGRWAANYQTAGKHPLFVRIRNFFRKIAEGLGIRKPDHKSVFKDIADGRVWKQGVGKGKVVDLEKYDKVELFKQLQTGKIGDIRKTVRKWAKDNITGTVRVASTGEDIIIAPNGINHGSYGKSVKKITATIYLPEMLQNAVKVGTEPEKTGRPDVKAVHKYGATIKLGNMTTDVILVVKEYTNGKRYYDHHLDKKNEPGTSGTASQGKLRARPTGSSINNIPQKPVKGKGNLENRDINGPKFALGDRIDQDDYVAELRRVTDMVEGRKPRPKRARKSLPKRSLASLTMSAEHLTTSSAHAETRPVKVRVETSNKMTCNEIPTSC